MSLYNGSAETRGIRVSFIISGATKKQADEITDGIFALVEKYRGAERMATFDGEKVTIKGGLPCHAKKSKKSKSKKPSKRK